jgi:antiphage defense system Thoeris ThsB-like protein
MTMAKRVYFAFDYEDVSDFRANVVRKHNFTGGVEKAGYFDASIWEEAKKKDPTALKRLINSELENTSVTAILIGSQTYARRWVRYEIVKSIERGNKVIGIHINSILDKNRQVKPLGPNPFDYLGMEISEDGTRGTPRVWNGTQWVYYQDLDAFTIAQQPLDKRGKRFQLSHWLPVYDWVANSGFQNFGSWVA